MKKYLLLFIATLFVTGCKHNSSGVEKPKYAIEFDAKIGLTKATEGNLTDGGQWEANDKIGMYVKDAATYLTSNVEYTWNSVTNKFETATPMFYGSFEKHELFGYYPYVATAPKTDLANKALAFTVNADQSAHAGYAASDLMYTKKSDITPQFASSDLLSIDFDHMLVNVRMKFKNAGDVAFVGNGAPKVILTNTNKGVTMNLLTGVVEQNTTPNVGDIVMQCKTTFASGVTKEIEYVAVAVPQTIDKGTKLFSIETDNNSGLIYTAILAADQIMNSKNEYVFNIKAKNIDMVIGAGEVKEWGQGASASGTAGGDGVRPFKLMFTFTSVPANIANATVATIKIDGNDYDCVPVWDAANSKLSIAVDLGDNWAVKFNKLKLTEVGGTTVYESTDLNIDILGDPTDPTYNTAINL